MALSRRQLLQGAATGLAATFGPLRWMEALAAPANDYKALVCIFLFGGNDGNNMVIPMEAAEYSSYATARAGMALAKDSLASIGAPTSLGGRTFGLHPGMADLAPLFQQKKLAVLCNVGTLLAPMTKAQYATRSLRPSNLYSHSDQANQWQTSQSQGIARSGWGGRIADAAYALNGGIAVPMVMSLSGSNLFSIGAQRSPLVLPTSGTFGLSGTTGTAGTARLDSVRKLLGLDRGNEMVDAASAVMLQAIDNSALMNPIINSTTSAAAPAFANLNSSIAKQLYAVARIIENRAATGLKRQIFFCSMGGYDTHSDQLNAQTNLLTQLGQAMAAFAKATDLLGVSDSVVTFTGSDFSRTLKPASGGGTDHAWGNHQLVMGGPVKGGDFYGTFPKLELKGPDDVDGAGRWIPTTSVDQYAATLANWFGVAPGDIGSVLPNLSRFATPNLGFL